MLAWISAMKLNGCKQIKMSKRELGKINVQRVRWILQSRKSHQHFSHPMEESGHHIGDLMNASRKECPSEDRVCGHIRAARPCVSAWGAAEEKLSL